MVVLDYEGPAGSSRRQIRGKFAVDLSKSFLHLRRRWERDRLKAWLQRVPIHCERHIAKDCFSEDFLLGAGEDSIAVRIGGGDDSGRDRHSGNEAHRSADAIL